MTGVWLIYGSAETVIGIDDLAERIAADPDVRQTAVDEDVLQITVHDPLTGHDADVFVSRDDGSHVALEARELADAPPRLDAGVPPPDLALLGRSDTRLEVTWDLERSDETFNVMLVIVDLSREFGSVVAYDQTNHRFV
jgi:hypothetical protein